MKSREERDSTHTLDLVILAAGMGQRFGGLKQLTPVGPGGEAIMDYNVYDALRAGFDRVILVIRPEIESAIRRHVDCGFGRHVDVHYVHQARSGDTQRTKPWGTAHAVLQAATVVGARFAIANADDRYGAPAFEALADGMGRDTWTLVGFEVAGTLPPDGAVTRGVLAIENGHLRSIDEVSGLRRHPGGVSWDAPEGLQVRPGSALISMNLWGFRSNLLAPLDDAFTAFRAASPGPDDELVLPVAIDTILRAHPSHTVRVVPTASPWCGITSAEDREWVEARIRSDVETGIYPERLWDARPEDLVRPPRHDAPET